MAQDFTNLIKLSVGTTSVEDLAAWQAARWVALFAADSITAISPISCAVAAVNADTLDALDPLDGMFWEGWCRPLLQACRAVVIPPIEGAQQSAGVWHEAVTALQNNCPVYVLSGELS